MFAVITDYAQKSMLKSTTLKKLFKLFDHSMVMPFLRLHHRQQGNVSQQGDRAMLLWTMALMVYSRLYQHPCNVKVCSTLLGGK